jgi:hypothetical protein
MAKSDLKREWQPNPPAFERLMQWLDEGADSHGERYLEMRDRLVRYFARRQSSHPEDLADETLNRVTRRLEENGSIECDAPARYCYIVAKFVLLESLRRARHTNASVREAEALVATPFDQSTQERERTYACLERCLAKCTPYDRQLMLDYYTSTFESARTQRKRLAERLGLSANALAIRACRIRSRLEVCVRSCCER